MNSDRDFCAPCAASDKAEPAFTTIRGTRMCQPCAKETFMLGVALLPAADPDSEEAGGLNPPGPGPSAALALVEDERYSGPVRKRP